MTTTPNKKHQKHANLSRPAFGEFGRLEFAILGAPCSVIQEKVSIWTSLVADKYKVAFVDADHKAESPASNFAVNYTDKISHQQIALPSPLNSFDRHNLFNTADLVLVNGNHFDAARQIVIIHPDKALKPEKLTNVALILVAAGQDLADHLENYITDNRVPILSLEDEIGISGFLTDAINSNIAPLKGLVLAGGKSTRMHSDKGAIAYHGKSQRAYAFDMLAALVDDVYISGTAEDGYPVIADTFTGLGPLGGILSAMQQDTDAAWLTIACDLPYLSAETLQYLIANRNPSKIATAFMDSEGKFPEPLITIWEPRAYARMLQFLSQGYSCPRKVLINSEIELPTAPDVSEFRNINFPAERDEALRFFGSL